LELRHEKALQMSMQHGKKTHPIPVRDDKLGVAERAAISLQVSLSEATQPLPTFDFPNSKY